MTVLVVDATAPVGKGDRFVAGLLPDSSICVVNKVDAASRAAGPAAARGGGSRARAVDEFFPVSARTGEGVEALVDAIVGRMPEGPLLYPDDMVTDVPEAFWVAELVREQLLAVTRDEVPHSIACRVTEWEWPRIRCEILVERDSQKGIVIGKGGQVLQRGRAPGPGPSCPQGAFLELFVKVDPNWQSRPKALERLGLTLSAWATDRRVWADGTGQERLHFGCDAGSGASGVGPGSGPIGNGPWPRRESSTATTPRSDRDRISRPVPWASRVAARGTSISSNASRPGWPGGPAAEGSSGRGNGKPVDGDERQGRPRHVHSLPETHGGEQAGVLVRRLKRAISAGLGRSDWVSTGHRTRSRIASAAAVMARQLVNKRQRPALGRLDERDQLVVHGRLVARVARVGQVQRAVEESLLVVGERTAHVQLS